MGDTNQWPDYRRKELTQLQDTRFVGLDVHKDSIAVAVAEGSGEVRDWGTIMNTPEAVRKLVRQLGPREKQWLEALALPRVAQQVVLREYLRALGEVTDRIGRLDGEIATLAQECPQAPVIKALGAFRGIGSTTAVTIVAELGEIGRFDRPTQLMAYAGLVPSEHSSGQSRRLGGITKTGNSHLRRVVVEAAWHYRHLPRVGVDLKRRQAGLDPSITAISWRAQSRLNRKYRRMVGRDKPKQKAVVAVARELPGFIWELARAVQQVPADRAA